ncbi:hypothetical protein KC318_g21587, partial [Hortaea werneckii]
MEAHYICLLREGRMVERGTYEQLMAMKGEIANLIKSMASDEGQSESEEASKASQSSPGSEGETVYGEDDPDDAEERAEAQEGLTQLAPIKAHGRGPVRQGSEMTLRRASTASFRGPRGKITDEEEGKGKKSGQSKEFTEQGKVKRDVYFEYARESNLAAVAIYLLMLVGAQTAQV